MSTNDLKMIRNARAQELSSFAGDVTAFDVGGFGARKVRPTFRRVVSTLPDGWCFDDPEDVDAAVRWATKRYKGTRKNPMRKSAVEDFFWSQSGRCMDGEGERAATAHDLAARWGRGAGKRGRPSADLTWDPELWSEGYTPFTFPFAGDVTAFDVGGFGARPTTVADYYTLGQRVGIEFEWWSNHHRPETNPLRHAVAKGLAKKGWQGEAWKRGFVSGKAMERQRPKGQTHFGALPKVRPLLDDMERKNPYWKFKVLRQSKGGALIEATNRDGGRMWGVTRRDIHLTRTGPVIRASLPSLTPIRAHAIEQYEYLRR